MDKIKRDWMEMYKSRPTAKVVKEIDYKIKMSQREWSHQIAFCKWLKIQHPEVRFRSDIQSSGKLTPAMQNIKKIIDPHKGWPDIMVYLKRGNYVGLGIELKRLDSGLYLKDGSLSKNKHVQEQAEFHEFLRGCGWYVDFAEGFEGAKELFEKYYRFSLSLAFILIF